MVTNLKEEFGHQYKTQDDGTNDPCRAERVWCMEIPGKYGSIAPWGRNGDLIVTCYSNRLLKRLIALGCKPEQEDTFENSLIFPKKMIHEVARIVKSRKRRQYTPAQLEKARAQMRLAKKYLKRSKH